jgi:hypothetical protein
LPAASVAPTESVCPGLEGDADLINRAMVLDGRTIGATGLP